MSDTLQPSAETVEERFLRAHQEREEQRLHRSKGVSEVVAQRQQFDLQAAGLEQASEAKLKAGDVAGAQSIVTELRALVLDASNSISLTAHDMARMNSSLARLQQAIDEAKRASSPSVPPSSSPSASGALTSDVAAHGRRFAFSRKLAGARAPAAPTDSTATTAPAMAAAGSHGATYGPADGLTIFISPATAAFVKDCTGCAILAVPVAGSVFVSNCRNCRLYVGCHQLRMKDCADMDVYVWCASTPIIEHCSGMRFGPYERWTGLLQSRVVVPGKGGAAPEAVGYPTHAEWVAAVGEISDLVSTRLNYQAVDDFQWLKKTASPHWRVLTAEEEREEPAPFPSNEA